MSIAMPKRQWEPPPVLPKYKAAVAMRHADVMEIPRGANALLGLAATHGWSIGDTTYASGDKLVRGEYQRIESIAIRLRHKTAEREVRAWAIWERRTDVDKPKWSYGGGQVLEVGVRLIAHAKVADIRAEIARTADVNESEVDGAPKGGSND